MLWVGNRAPLPLISVRSVEVVVQRIGIFEYFAFAEESFHLDFGSLDRVRGVDDVLLTTHREVATYSAGSSLASVGSANYVAHNSNSAVALNAHGNDRSRLHRGCVLRGEGTVEEVSIVLVEDSVVELHHFQANDAQTFALDAVDDFADETALNCTRL